jgi:hypothetical protein
MPSKTAKCSKCKRVKRKSLFYKDRSRNSGVSSYCKSCKKKNDSKRTGKYGDRDTDGRFIYTVYYLPEHHYVGMTKDVECRIRDHNKKGKITDGYEIIARFKDPKLAHLMETRLHIMGYNGFHYIG